MLVKTFGSAVYGVEAITIAVEVNINNQGKSEAVIVGLPDSACLLYTSPSPRD